MKNRKHALTIDYEDWFQIFFATDIINKSDWQDLDSKIQDMSRITLELLAEQNVHATFFVVGWLAEHHPELIRIISDAGHEIASHSYWHEEVHTLSREEFKEDARRSKRCIEDAVGAEVRGYRAPGYSIRENQEWALEILANEGYRYDSSMLHAPEAFYKMDNGMFEVRPNSLKILGRHMPSNGGFFFRLLPYFLFKKYVDILDAREMPLIFYTHTWELYTNYPKVKMSALKEIIQYFNRDSLIHKMRNLTTDFPFESIKNSYPEIGSD